jgi:hypothetical protein
MAEREPPGGGGGRHVLGSSFVRDFINFNLEEGDLVGMSVAGGLEALRELYDSVGEEPGVSVPWGPSADHPIGVHST